MKYELSPAGNPGQDKDERDNVASAKATPQPPTLLPLTVRITLKNRIVVFPMATYSAIDGLVQDFHLVHLGARVLGGAALVMVEMTASSPDGRITPACTGLWTDVHGQAFGRIVDFVHASGRGVRIGLQRRHSGPKGSTQLGWARPGEPLAEGNWPLLAASAVAYGPTNQTLQAMTRHDMDRVTADFVSATRHAARVGFDWLELHCARGYLLSSFIIPLTNHRQDDYGGSQAQRCRFPLEVFSAMRAVWPADLPMSVRISAHDLAPGGHTADDAVAIARLFKSASCDVINVSSGQTTRTVKPVHRRRPRRPVRAGPTTPGRPCLDAARGAQLQSRQVRWPRPYGSGRDQLYQAILKRNPPLAPAKNACSALIFIALITSPPHKENHGPGSLRPQ